ncbi:MAG: hypothetical protein MRY83_03980, partial [Flavobacteriales bacterium]|nr:hypothetical protein [Flavobacteriales bacterium]
MADSFEDENKIFDQILFQSYVRANQSLERQSKLVNTGNRPFFLENRGDMQYSLGNYDSARYYYNLIIRDTEKYESYDILIAFKKAICEWYLLNNQHFTESFEKFKTIDKKLLTGIEIDYLWVKEKLMRRTAYDSASSVIEKIKDHFVFFNDKVLWMDIQLTYNETISANKMKIGEINLNKVVEHTLEAKDSVMTTLFATRLATYYSIHRKFEKAENIFDQFEGICDNPYVKHVFDFARGYNFKSQGNYQEALKIMTNCLSYSRESG